MGEQLKIDGDEAVRLAAELAGLWGESISIVVTRALREALEHERNALGIEDRLQRIRAITADIRSNLKHPLPTSDHSWLYDDETGLPR